MSGKQPHFRVVPMTLFPTLGSVSEAIDLANSKLPITNKNELFALLMTFQNTVLSSLNKPE